MRLCGIMCFSSSIICLLVITGHGSAVPGHLDESGGPGTTRINSTEYRRNHPSALGVRSILNSPHHKGYQKDLIAHEYSNSSAHKASHTSRKQRHAEDSELTNQVSSQTSAKNNAADPGQQTTHQNPFQSENSNNPQNNSLKITNHQPTNPETGLSGSSQEEGDLPDVEHHGHGHHNHDEHDHHDHDEHDHRDHDKHNHHDHDEHDHRDHDKHNHHDHEGHDHRDHDKQNHHDHDEHDHHNHDESEHHDGDNYDVYDDSKSKHHKHHKDDGLQHEDDGDYHHEDEYDEEDGHTHTYDGVTSHKHSQSSPKIRRYISGKVWLWSSLAVIVISLCGLLSVAVIPIMQKWFYHTLLQFLVGLAVGSLSGDGLLHLMPHAILGGEESHDHSSHNHHSLSLEVIERTAIWRGLAALGGIFLFFIAERLLGAVTAHRRQKREAKLSGHTKSMIPVMQREDGANNGNVGEKLAQPKKNSYDHIREKDEKETIQMLQAETTPSRKGSLQSHHEIGFHGRSSFSLEPEMSVAYRPDSESSVIVSDHHGHTHGHSHEIPQSVSAVAWMVIMGDGLHNFCDGLAIGAAFASSDADGVSTTVAVFCHELPHELGDFAMLLKTGMKVKQALFYNGLSSILCFVGMVIGVCLGNVNSATNWVFAGTAGMFLYIALVDMLPELATGTESGKAAISTLIVQVSGIAIGICVMLLIALYEHKLSAIVS